MESPEIYTGDAHEFQVIETVGADEMVTIRCVKCPWENEPVHPRYVDNIKSRHLLSHNWWPWEEDGKPRSTNENGQIAIDTDWPYGKGDK